MHVIIRRSLCAAVFAGGLLALGTGAASAADQPSADTTSTVQGGASQSATDHTVANGTRGLLGGLVGDVLGNVQVAVPVSVPVNVSGNAVGVLGDAVSDESEAAGTTTVPAVEQKPGLGSGQGGSHNAGGLLGGVVGDVLGKVQVALPIKVPVNVSGNAVGVLDNAVTNGSEAGNTVAPVAPVAPVTPLTPVIPVTPVNPVTPVTPSTTVTPENPAAHVAPAAHVTPTATLNNVQAMSSGLQVLGSAAPHQFARTGSGLWPVYLSVLVLLAGLGLILMARRFGYRTVA